MIAPLLVLVAHGLDSLTFLLALQRWGTWGESNPIAAAVIATAGVGGLLLLKAGGAAVLAWIIRPSRHWSTEGRFGGGVRLRPKLLLFASAAGILGAASNVTALLV